VPTLYKPVSSDPESLWSVVAVAISAEVDKHRPSILDALNFDEEYGRIGHHGGKFDAQIKRAQDEVLEEIKGVLTYAAVRAAKPSVGQIIATLEESRRKPSAVQDPNVPGFVQWHVADRYQVGEEPKGTLFPHIMGFSPDGYPHSVEIPHQESVVEAVSAAIADLKQNRVPGRSRSEVTRIVASGLRSIYLCFNSHVARRYETSSLGDGQLIQIETGQFSQFVRAVLDPLAALLDERGLKKKFAVSSIARMARYPDPP
jgi:hypothetical protein